MRRAARASLLLGGACLAAPCARAQLGEFQIGVLACYGTGDAFGPGVGAVLGVAPGRLVYVGLRWAYHTGIATRPGPALEARTRAQTYTVDLGFQIPAGKLEVTPGVSLGVARFAQHVRQSTPGGGTVTTARHATEFLVAPGVAVAVYISKVALIPEVQYRLAGAPELARAVQHAGPVATLRLVIPLEVGHIRR